MEKSKLKTEQNAQILPNNGGPGGSRREATFP